MTRPTYETPQDRRNQGDVAASLERITGLRLIGLPQHSRVDYVGADHEGQAKALFEIKRRGVSWKTYPTLMLSLNKAAAMIELERLTSLPANLVVQWDDALGIVRPAKVADQLSISKGGRWDRGDAQDVEDVVHFDIELFTMLKEDEE